MRERSGARRRGGRGHWAVGRAAAAARGMTRRNLLLTLMCGRRFPESPGNNAGWACLNIGRGDPPAFRHRR